MGDHEVRVFAHLCLAVYFLFPVWIDLDDLTTRFGLWRTTPVVKCRILDHAVFDLGALTDFHSFVAFSVSPVDFFQFGIVSGLAIYP